MNYIDDFFQKQATHSGHSLEIQVENTLQNNFELQREVPYLDKDESKGRFIDLVATRQIPPDEMFTSSIEDFRVVAQMNLIIECKNLQDHGWMFWETNKSELIMVDNASMADYIPPDLLNDKHPSNKYIPYEPLEELFFAWFR